MAGFDTLILRTERLRLRPLRAADAPALFSIFSDPQVMRYGSTLPWASLQAAERMIAQDETAMPAGEHLRLGLERTADAALIGTCTLFALHAASRRAEVGYALAAAAWHQGFAQEAVCALLDHGFGPMGLNRVEADIHPDNAASARLLQRLGFEPEGRLRERWIVGDEVSDSALYGLLQRDWAARRRHLA